MANTGLSAVWHDEGKRWEIRELPLPEIEPDGVSIRVQATSVCGSDLTSGVAMASSRKTVPAIRSSSATR